MSDLVLRVGIEDSTRLSGPPSVSLSLELDRCTSAYTVVAVDSDLVTGLWKGGRGRMEEGTEGKSLQAHTGTFIHTRRTLYLLFCVNQLWTSGGEAA
ncbi:hypothetical protein GN956_G25901 [Arapaima gigas]